MATPIRSKQRGRALSYANNRPSTPLRTLALNLTHVARAAISEPYMLTIEHERIALRRLPKEFESFRIVQLSDIHHGPFSDREQIEARYHRFNWRLHLQGTPLRRTLCRDVR